MDRSFRGSWSGYERDFMFLNPDGPSPAFYNAAWLAGLDFDDDGRAAVPVDVDGDGDLDLVLMSLQRLSLIENTSPPRHFARVRLAATKTHAAALNAVVRVTAGGVTRQDYVRLTDGFQSQVPLDLHFGLGDAARIEKLEVVWPSGDAQVFAGLPADRLIRIREGEAAPAVEELRRWPEEGRRRARPEFTFDAQAERLEGGRAPVAARGRPAVLTFWSPACATCLKELPAFAAAAARWQDRAQFAGISVEVQDVDKVRAAAKSLGLGFPQFLADDPLVRSFFGPERTVITPSTFVFDGAGRLRRAFRRAVADDELAALLDSFGDEGTSADALDARGRRLGQLGRFQEAVDLLEKAIAADPRHALAHYHLALAMDGLGRRDPAIRLMEKSVQLDPDYWSAHFNLAALYHDAGRFREAAEEYRQALRLRGEDADILLSLGSSAGAAQQYPAALEAFDRAVKAAPGSAEAWAARGQLLLHLGEIPRAKADFEKALSLDPNQPAARAYMKDIEKMTGGGK